MTLEHRSSDEEDALLSALTAEESLAGLAAEAPSPAGLTPRERALVAYADALTRAPGLVRRSHIEALRAAGLDDRAIHDACAIVAYFAFVNRIADGLGVELET
ncbi:MAG: carboxymuconolactone decarboxylase family protein [Vicinamibacterales bacterium]